jgi:hypothetical protein
MLKAWLVIINILTKYKTLESHVQGLSAPFSSFFWAFFALLINKIMVKIRPKRGSEVKTVSFEV